MRPSLPTHIAPGTGREHFLLSQWIKSGQGEDSLLRDTTARVGEQPPFYFNLVRSFKGTTEGALRQ